MKKGLLLAAVIIMASLAFMSFTAKKITPPVIVCYNSRYGTGSEVFGYPTYDEAVEGMNAHQSQAQGRVASKRVYGWQDPFSQVYRYYYEICYNIGF